MYCSDMRVVTNLGTYIIIKAFRSNWWTLGKLQVLGHTGMNNDCKENEPPCIAHTISVCNVLNLGKISISQHT